MKQLGFPFAETKQCSRCGHIKPLSEFESFPIDNSISYRTYCKQCHKRGTPDPVREEQKQLFVRSLRRCTVCNEIKPLASFYGAANADGLTSVCRTCLLERQCPGLRKRNQWRKERAELEIQGKRRCKECKKVQPLDDFYLDKNGQRENRCASCIRERQSPGAATQKQRKKQLRKQGLKQCTRCKEIKPFSAFYIDSQRPGHYLPKCKSCFTEMSKDWSERNRDKIRVYWHRRRARKHNAKGSHTTSDINRLYEEQNGQCPYQDINPLCQGFLSDNFHVDHIIPLARGGSNGPENLQLLCPHCNQSKNARTHEEYLEWLRLVHI